MQKIRIKSFKNYHAHARQQRNTTKFFRYLIKPNRPDIIIQMITRNKNHMNLLHPIQILSIKTK